MNEKDRFETIRPDEIAWRLFCETGEIGYYEFYRRLSEEVLIYDARIDKPRDSTEEFGLSR